MGNGTSSQGGTPPHDKRDVGTSVANGKQHDCQAEQAVAPKQKTHSLLEETRKPYNNNNNNNNNKFNIIDLTQCRIYRMTEN